MRVCVCAFCWRRGMTATTILQKDVSLLLDRLYQLLLFYPANILDRYFSLRTLAIKQTLG